jgi:hypothetical protein
MRQQKHSSTSSSISGTTRPSAAQVATVKLGSHVGVLQSKSNYCCINTDSMCEQPYCAPAPLQVAAKKLDRRLAALGAIPLLERGLGDDQVSDPPLRGAVTDR